MAETTGVAEEQVAKEHNRLFTEFLAALASAKRVLLICGVVFATLGFLYQMRLKDYYVASIQFVTPQLRIGPSYSLSGSAGGGSVGDLGGLSNLQNAFAARSQADTFLVIVKAWPLADALVKRLDLTKLYGVQSPIAARAIVQGSTSATADKGFVTLTVVDADPKRATTIANGYIVVIREFLAGMALTEASQRKGYYETQVKAAGEELAAAEEAFKTVEKRTHMVSSDSQSSIAMQTAMQLRTRISNDELELVKLRSYLTDQNPQVQSAETSLAGLRRQLAQAESTGTGGFTGGGMANVPDASLDFAHASRDLKYQEAVYDLLLRQFSAARLDEARDAPVVQVIAPAQVPTAPAGPRRTIYPIAGFAFGCLLGFLFILWRFLRVVLSAETIGLMAQVRRAVLRW